MESNSEDRKEEDGGGDNDSQNNTGTAKNPKWMSRRQASSLLLDSELAIQKAFGLLQEANELASKSGLSVASSIIPKPGLTAASPFLNNAGGSDSALLLDPIAMSGGGRIGEEQSQKQQQNLVLSTTKASNLYGTGGHSNTNHVVLMTGDEKTDRVAELKRNMIRRHRAMQPENRGEYRWDKPRVPGERRRRIVHERDLPQAPPEPPLTGYVLFVGQMTTKIRHDRGVHVPHDQTKTVQEISNLWKIGMSDEERQYYNTSSNEARDEYEKQFIEYRATGSYKVSKNYRQLEGSNVWVRTNPALQNALEKEICCYDTVLFPPRPPSQEEEYRGRDIRSKFRRKLKLRGMLNEDGTVKDGFDDFETLLAKDQKEREEKEKQAESGVQKPKEKRKRKPRKKKEPPNEKPEQSGGAVANALHVENSNQIQKQQGADREPPGKGESKLKKAATATSEKSQTPPALEDIDGEEQTDTAKTVDDASAGKKRRKLDEEVERDECPTADAAVTDFDSVAKQNSSARQKLINRPSESSTIPDADVSAATEMETAAQARKVSTSLEEGNNGEDSIQASAAPSSDTAAGKKRSKQEEDAEGQEKDSSDDVVATKKASKRRKKGDTAANTEQTTPKKSMTPPESTVLPTALEEIVTEQQAAATKPAPIAASTGKNGSEVDADVEEDEKGILKEGASVSKRKTRQKKSPIKKQVSGGASPRRRSSRSRIRKYPHLL